jgi:hypothetical protein
VLERGPTAPRGGCTGTLIGGAVAKLLPIDLGLLLSTNTAAHVDALGSDVEVNGAA